MQAEKQQPPQKINALITLKSEQLIVTPKFNR